MTVTNNSVSVNVASLTSFMQLIATLIAAVLFALHSHAGWLSPLYALPPLLTGVIVIVTTSALAYGVLLRDYASRPVLEWVSHFLYSILPALGLVALIFAFALLAELMLPQMPPASSTVPTTERHGHPL